MHHTRSILLFAASLLGSAVLTAPSFSDAFQRRSDATICHPSDSTAITGGFGLTNNSTSFGFARCPVSNDTDQPINGVTGLIVRGFDGSSSGSVSASACVTNISVAGGSCGASDSSGAATVGDYMLQPSLTEWSDAANISDYPDVLVTLPGRATGESASTLRGFWVSN